ncbi:DHA2 family efflux MFS transporter permease subunit [Thiopseudomonas alkaliphila]|uniref:DHA2 family efflux MFS transporter permease subunit n=1 Tax=Thiopseudomonas alkaliphila TaxID=1697053 RepID=UPI0007DC2060|nr:DHA2 family efflux MFS transporter permease subunit [Thiopseudomonas alkaliphila]
MYRDLDMMQKHYGARYKTWLLSVLLLGSMVMVLSSTSINVALPEIMNQFHMGRSMAQWLVTGFLAAMTSGLLLAAWIQARIGAQNTVQLSIGVFLMASVLALIATEGWQLIALRIIQGACAGIIQPLATVLIFRVYKDGRRGRALGIYGLGLMIAPTVGPTISGYLVDAYGWMAAFWLPMPVCVLLQVVGPLLLPNDREPEAKRLDVLALVLLTVSLFAGLGGLAEAQLQNWDSPWVYGPIALAFACLIGFFVVTLGKENALLPLDLWRIPAYRRASWIALALGMGLYASTYFIPLFLQTVGGFTAGQSGLILLPAGIFLGCASYISGWLCDRMNFAWILIIGLLLFALSKAWYGLWGVSSGYWWLCIWAAIGRAGMGLLGPAINTASLENLTSAQLAQGASGITFVRQLGGAFGINLLTAFLEWRFEVRGGTPEADNQAFEETFWLMGLAFALALWPAWRLRPGPLNRAELRYQKYQDRLSAKQATENTATAAQLSTDSESASSDISTDRQVDLAADAESQAEVVTAHEELGELALDDELAKPAVTLEQADQSKSSEQNELPAQSTP